MRKECRCRLCGQELCEDGTGECRDWEVRYCSYLCYLTDSLLPPMPTESLERIYNVSSRVMMLRYSMVVKGDDDPIYKEKFTEEEDDLKR